MFDARSGPELLKQIVEIFGTNGKDEAFKAMTETEWHKRATESLWSHFGSLAAATDGPLGVWTRLGEDGVNLLTAMFRPDPAGRLTSAGVVEHAYLNRNVLRCVRHFRAERGLFSLAVGQLEHRVLEWIRGDGCWQSIVLSEIPGDARVLSPPQKRRRCMGNGEMQYKREICYLFDAWKPCKKTTFLANPVAERIPSVRLLAWGEAPTGLGCNS